ncbi:hypothetical protein R83H12_00295 [Fibrobacteria bacterium R8-3-H12]
MRNMVKFSFIASVLLLISCSSDFPPVPEMKFCKLNNGKCESIHIFSESNCKAAIEIVGGCIVNSKEECNEDCKDEVN